MANTPLKSTYANLDILRLIKLSTISLPAPNADNEGAIVYDSTTQTLKVSNGAAWTSAGSSLTLAAIGSTPNVNAATLTGSTLNLEPASASFGGVLTAGSQGIGGNKWLINKLGVGMTAAPAVAQLQINPSIDAFNTNAALAVNWENPTGGYSEAIDGYIAVRGSYDTSNVNFVGVFGTVDYASSVATTGSMIGTYGWASSSDVNVGNLIGAIGAARGNNSGTVSNAAGLYSQGVYKGGGTAAVTRGYGLYVINNNNQATTAYNIFVEGTSPDTTDYFYTSNPGSLPFVVTSTNKLGVGTISPVGPIHVTDGVAGHAIVMDAAGQVGIGTTAPTAFFQVSSSSGANTSLLSQVAGSELQLAVAVGTGAGTRTAFNLGHTSTATGSSTSVSGYSASVVQAGSGSIGTMAGYIASTSGSGGSLGTVTTLVGYLANSLTAGVATVTTKASFYSKAQSSATTLNAGYYSESFADANFPFYYAGTSGKQFVVTGAGKTGIGNAAPTRLLHVGSSTDYLAADTTGSVQYYSDQQNDITSSGSMVGQYAQVTKVSAAGINNLYGSYHEAWLAGTLGLSGEMVGHYSRVVPNQASGTLSATYASVSEAVLINNGPITDLVGHNIRARRDSGTAVVTNQYGLKIDPVTFGTSNYAISYINGSPARFTVNGGGTTDIWAEDCLLSGNTNVALYTYTAKIVNSGISNIKGIWADIEFGGTLGLIGELIAVHAMPYIYHTSGTVANVCGVSADIVWDGATGSVTNMVGVSVNHRLNSGSWSVTNAYGIKIESINGGTSNYAIYYKNGEFSVDGSGNLVNTGTRTGGFEQLSGGGSKTPSKECVAINSTASATTLNLPAAASSTGLTFKIKKTDSSANSVTIDANGSELIEGSTTYVLSAQYDSVILVCDGTGWLVW
jgi:hypothetical protein